MNKFNNLKNNIRKYSNKNIPSDNKIFITHLKITYSYLKQIIKIYFMKFFSLFGKFNLILNYLKNFIFIFVFVDFIVNHNIFNLYKIINDLFELDYFNDLLLKNLNLFDKVVQYLQDKINNLHSNLTNSQEIHKKEVKPVDKIKIVNKDNGVVTDYKQYHKSDLNSNLRSNYNLEPSYSGNSIDYVYWGVTIICGILLVGCVYIYIHPDIITNLFTQKPPPATPPSTPPTPIFIELTGDEAIKESLSPTSSVDSLDSDKTVQFKKYLKKKPEEITIKSDNDNNDWS
uniref:Uncharacterized protein n=1 Tax=Heterobasidion irregulare TaxID=984962 RepID=A0A075DDS6_9AGAM|nr:hypothetical protein [Heterobasidion irregulare]AHK09740.1 hypothetical protein [Heterobasidion irregulare]